MRMWTTKDAHCPSCRGSGHLSEGRFVDGEWWESFFDCHCVQVHHDDEMKAFLAKNFVDATVQSIPVSGTE